MLERRRSRAVLLRAALCYGTEQGWPVTPGTYLNHGRCSCGDRRCPRPGQHPAEPSWHTTASARESVIRAWWSVAPHAILIPAGVAFDVLDVPVRAGVEAMRELALGGRGAGPVLATGAGRLQFLVRPHARDVYWYTIEHNDAVGIDVRHVGSGGYVVAPPSGNELTPGALWAVPPDRSCALPDAVDLLGALLHCCAHGRRTAGRPRRVS